MYIVLRVAKVYCNACKHTYLGVEDNLQRSSVFALHQQNTFQQDITNQSNILLEQDIALISWLHIIYNTSVADC